MKTLISLLGADIVNQEGTWQTNDLNIRHKVDELASDSFRVIATSFLLHQNPDAVVLLQGGLADEIYPSLASVMKNELTNLGITSNRILMEERSKTTFQQLCELQNLIRQAHPECLQILTNEWHLPRVKTMVESLPILAELHKQSPEYVAAEEILMNHDSKKWQPRITAMHTLVNIQKVIAHEKKGIQQLRNGTYKF